MDLYLIRHAEAQDQASDGSADDLLRPLTERGKNQARAVATTLQRQGIGLQLILASPLLRARETAEEMIKHWKMPAPELQIVDELAPGARRKKLTKILRNLSQESVALVGHEPNLSQYAAVLIGSKKVQIEMSKAGVAALHFEEPPGKGVGSLRWLVTPAWLCEPSPASAPDDED